MLRRSLRQLSRLTQPQLSGYYAAVCLIAIQVGIGIIMKASQSSQGQFAFSTLSSVALSEFLKLLLSLLFFWRECRDRPARSEGYEQVIPHSERASLELEPFNDDTRNPDDNYLDDPEKLAAMEEAAKMFTHKTSASKSKVKRETSLRLTGGDGRQYGSFWEICLNEVPSDGWYGYVQLALLYALINNTIFIAYKLADPGTIMITKSGITLITALVMMVTLDSRLTTTQWMAIIFQLCGLIVTQYHSDTGTSYPIGTYLVLLFQVFVSAVSGVYNQALLKGVNASLHAQNMALYASGFVINIGLYTITKILKPDEPGLFQGFDGLGAFLVILSNVFIGLAINAVYKYADALVKCFSTAISTSILLYLSPIFFGANTSFLVLPGTVIIFIASWLYIRGAAESGRNAFDQTAKREEDGGPTVRQKLGNWARHHRGVALGFGILCTIAIISVNALPERFIPNLSSIGNALPGWAQPKPQKTIESPFKTTHAMIRWNRARPERIPLLSKYEPYFNSIHFSMPDYVQRDTWNLTHDGFPSDRTIYQQVARTMQVILDAPIESEITGLLYYHFDAWIQPFGFSDANFDNIWWPLGNNARFYCGIKKRADYYYYPHWWPTARNNWDYPIFEALHILDSMKLDYTFDPESYCVGWADLYYIPRRLFADFIFLASIFAGCHAFHEMALATIVQILDQSRRIHPKESIVDYLGDCWGDCCTVNPTPTDVALHRCGHKLNYANSESAPAVESFYGGLDRQASLLGSPVPKTIWKEVMENGTQGVWDPTTVNALREGWSKGEFGRMKYNEEGAPVDGEGKVLPGIEMGKAEVDETMSLLDTFLGERSRNYGHL